MKFVVDDGDGGGGTAMASPMLNFRCMRGKLILRTGSGSSPSGDMGEEGRLEGLRLGWGSRGRSRGR